MRKLYSGTKKEHGRDFAVVAGLVNFCIYHKKKRGRMENPRDILP